MPPKASRSARCDPERVANAALVQSVSEPSVQVAGDPVYGRPGELGLERQFLHAARLAFPHPMSGEPVETESPLPPDLAAALVSAQA